MQAGVASRVLTKTFVLQWGKRGEKGPKGIGSGSLLPSCFPLFCQVKVQNLKEYKISEFEAGLPSLIESQNIIMK